MTTTMDRLREAGKEREMSVVKQRKYGISDEAHERLQYAASEASLTMSAVLEIIILDAIPAKS